MDNTTIWKLYKATLPSQLAVLTFLVVLFILISNVLVILTLSRKAKLTIQEHSILELVGSDLIVFIMTMAVAVIEQKLKIRLPQAFCEVLGISATVSANITTMIHTAMSIDRWVSVRFSNNVSLLQG